MSSSIRCRSFAWILLLALAGCGGTSSEAKSPSQNTEMTPQEAREFIAQARRDNGTASESDQPVSSVDELLEVIQADQVRRFDEAKVFLEGKSGIEVLAHRTTLELAESDLYFTLELILRELRVRADATAARLSRKQESGQELREAEQEELEKADNRSSYLSEAETAVGVLARDHLAAAGPMVDELLRQFPQDDRAYRVAAFQALLAEDWNRYDAAIDRFAAVEDQDPGLKYLRAGEALVRANMVAKARDELMKALELNPKLVRAQAKLVLIQDDIESTHAELEKLRALSPDHPVVVLAGTTLDEEYAVATEFSSSRSE